MNFFRTILISTLFCCFTLPINAAEYTAETFEAVIGNAGTSEEIASVCKEYLENATDIEVLRQAQDSWSEADAGGARGYSFEKQAAYPKSAQWAYLAGRLAETSQQKIDMGRLAIKLDKKFPYGYRLLCATYVQDLFNGDESDAEYAALKKQFKSDKKAFEKVSKLVPDQDWAQGFYNSYLMYVKDYKATLKHLEQCRERKLPIARRAKFADAYAGLGQFDKVYELVLEEVAEYQAGDAESTMSAAEKEAERNSMILYYYAQVLTRVDRNVDLIAWLKKRPDAESNSEVQFYIASAEARLGNKTAAFAALARASQNGFDQVSSLYRTAEINALADDPRWNTVVEGVKANWEAGSGLRKQKTLAAKINKLAADWTLADKDGNMVHLADMRGQVVILDFWATWCGPCRMAMPVIDKFIKTEKPEGVRVFSVNVWENAPAKAKAFMTDNSYAMELVFGNKEVAEAYGIKGIPYICAIDKDGVIRFEASGYSDGLEEDLRWWAEELLRE